MKATRYEVMGPDELPIAPILFHTIEAAQKGIEAFVGRFKHQGYFSCVRGRIALDLLASTCEITKIEIDVMDNHERFTANHFLSDYDADLTWHELITEIESESDEVSIWEPFEHRGAAYVIECMEAMLSSLRECFPADVMEAAVAKADGVATSNWDQED